MKQDKKKQIDYTKEIGISQGKQPPNSVDFERLIIGTMLIDKLGLDKVLYIYGDNPEIFYDPRHALIYDVISNLTTRKIPVDMMSVILELKKREKLGEAGGDHYIIDLTMGVSSSAHIDYHARIVMEKYFARVMQNNCAETLTRLYEERTDVFEMLDGMRGTVNNLEVLITSAKENLTAKNAHFEMLENYKRKEPPTVPVNYKDLNHNLEGFNAGDVVILGARPSIGKTAVALNFAVRTAAQNIPTCVFCLEMSALQMHQRVTANFCDVSFYRLNRKILNEAEIQKLYTDNAADLEKMPLEYDETKNLFQILSRIRVLAKKGFKFFVIDYLQIITTDGMKFGSREQEIAFISRSLKAIALELKIVIMPLAQVGREVDKRGIKRPVIADLRESGAIEADADIVCLLYRPEFYGVKQWDDNEQGATDGQIELQFAKYRNGSPFDARMKFWGDRMRLADLADEAEFYINPARRYNGADSERTNDDGDFDAF